MKPLPELDEEAAAQALCPNCRTAQTVDPVTVLHPDDDDVEGLFRGTLNTVTCDGCQSTFLLNVPLLFRDDERRCLIYYLPLDDPARLAELQEKMQGLTERAFAELPDGDVPTCRLTVNRKDFIEKIALHMQHLDDRLVEYVKYQLYNGPSNKVDGVRSELRYDFSSPDGDRMAFLIIERETGNATGGIHIPQEVYDDLADLFLTDEGLRDELAQLFPGFCVSCDRLL